MASVCGTSLALMDAGVPIKAPVAGVAMGLVLEGGKFQVLTDILGDEDHLGDMDFKVAGTSDGVTALQMDIKIEGITREIMQVALEHAHNARLHILGEMAKVISAPRPKMSEWAPTIITIKIDPEKIREVIGKGGAVIRAITEETGTSIDIEHDGIWIIRELRGGDRFLAESHSRHGEGLANGNPCFHLIESNADKFPHCLINLVGVVHQQNDGRVFLYIRASNDGQLATCQRGEQRAG